MVGFPIGGVPVMMVQTARFEQFSGQPAVEGGSVSEVLISLGAPDRAYVDALAERVRDAGGEIYSAPAELDGWMYNVGFADLDGHRWNVLFMDLDRQPQP